MIDRFEFIIVSGFLCHRICHSCDRYHQSRTAIPPRAPYLRLRESVISCPPRRTRGSLLGKSGSGKSTLLNLLGGLDRPTIGSLEVGGHELQLLSSGELARLRLATVGMIFQSFNLIPSRTALENVELPMIFAGRPPSERRVRPPAARWKMWGLGARLHHRPAQMSGGEKHSAWQLPVRS